MIVDIVDLVMILLGIWTLDDRSEIMGLHHLFIVLETGLGLGFQLFRVFSSFSSLFYIFSSFLEEFWIFLEKNRVLWPFGGILSLLEAF